MRKFLRIGALVLGAAVLVVGAGLTLILQSAPDRLVSRGIEQFQTTTGMNVSVAEIGALEFSPLPGVHVKNIRITRSDGSVVATAERAEVGIELLQLWTGTAQPSGLQLVRPKIALTAADLDTVADTALSASQDIGFGQIDVVDGSVDIDLPDQMIALTGVGATIGVSVLDGAITLDGQADWRNRPVALNGRLDTLERLRNGQLTNLQATLTLGTIEIDFDGRTKRHDAATPFLQGVVTLTAADAADLRDWVQIAGPIPLDRTSDVLITADLAALPSRLRVKSYATANVAGRQVFADLALSGGRDWFQQGPYQLDVVSRVGALYSIHFTGQTDLVNAIWGPVKASVLDTPALVEWAGWPDADLNWQRTSFNADLSVTPFGAAMQAIQLRLDEWPASGALAADIRGNKPVISASLQASDLQIPWPDPGEKAIAAGLRAVEDLTDSIALDLSLQRLSIGNLPIARLEASLAHQGPSLSTSIQQLDVFAGTLNGDVDLPNGFDGPVTGRINGALLNANQMARALDIDGMSGDLGGELEFKVPDIAEPLAGLNLNGELSLVDGALPLAGLTDWLRGSDSNLDLISMQLQTKDAVISMDPVSVAAGLRRLTGQASLNLQTTNLQVQLTPDADEADRGVQISGPLDALAGQQSIVTESILRPDANSNIERESLGDASVEPNAGVEAQDTGIAPDAASEADIDPIRARIEPPSVLEIAPELSSAQQSLEKSAVSALPVESSPVPVVPRR